MTAELDSDGFAILDSVLTFQQIAAIIADIENSGANSAGVRQPQTSINTVREIVVLPTIRELVEQALGRNARVVRSILFDKTPEKNWGVPWHQDLTIAVEKRREVAGFVGWSVKDDVHHVQAPREILEQMLTVRLHLDDCGPDNGPLRVLPGTHRNGWLDSEAIEQFKREIPEHVCIAPRGAAVIIRPLLLHASSRATKPEHRRILHLEFAADDLPGGLRFCSQ